MPPPTPARMRNTAALGRFGAKAVPIEARPTSKVPASKTGFRPYASENGPTTRAVAAQATAAEVTS